MVLTHLTLALAQHNHPPFLLSNAPTLSLPEQRCHPPLPLSSPSFPSSAPLPSSSHGEATTLVVRSRRAGDTSKAAVLLQCGHDRARKRPPRCVLLQQQHLAGEASCGGARGSATPYCSFPCADLEAVVPSSCPGDGNGMARRMYLRRFRQGGATGRRSVHPSCGSGPNGNDACGRLNWASGLIWACSFFIFNIQ